MQGEGNFKHPRACATEFLRQWQGHAHNQYVTNFHEAMPRGHTYTILSPPLLLSGCYHFRCKVTDKNGTGRNTLHAVNHSETKLHRIERGIMPREMALSRIIFHLCIICFCSFTSITGKLALTSLHARSSFNIHIAVCANTD